MREAVTMLDDVMTQIRTISSGTLATISGLTRYDELDALREDWLVWSLHQIKRKIDWQESWRDYSEEHAFVKYAGNVSA